MAFYLLIQAVCTGLMPIMRKKDAMKFFKPTKFFLILTLAWLGSLLGCGGSETGPGQEGDGTVTSSGSPAGTTPGVPGSGPWLTAYYPSYRQFEMPPSEFDYSAMTHLIHWPVLPKADGGLDTMKMDFTEAHSVDVVARSHAAGIKVLLGIGGNTDSGATAGFQGATSPANRATFIKNTVALMKARGYDGVDINWEEIRVVDDAQFVALIVELRQALDAVSPRPLLTMPPTTGFDGRPELIAQVHQHLDQINLQTYVMSGAYAGWVTWPNSPLSNGGAEFPSVPGQKLPSVEVEVDRFANAGIPLNRMAIGVQLDAFVWKGGSGTDTGGVTRPRQEWTLPPTIDVIPYKDVILKFTAAQGFQKQFDAVAKVPFLSLDSANNADDRFVSFDDEQAILEKAQYLKAKGLGGMFLFEIAGDYLPGQAQPHPLLNAAKESVLSK